MEACRPVVRLFGYARHTYFLGQAMALMHLHVVAEAKGAYSLHPPDWRGAQAHGLYSHSDFCSFLVFDHPVHLFSYHGRETCLCVRDGHGHRHHVHPIYDVPVASRGYDGGTAPQSVVGKASGGAEERENACVAPPAYSEV